MSDTEPPPAAACEGGDNNDEKTPAPTTTSAPASSPPPPKDQHQHNPAAVLASTSVARTLTISDQHANILLTTKSDAAAAGDDDDDANQQQKALLKLTLVPFHKTDLACLPRVTTTTTDGSSVDDPEGKKVDGDKGQQELAAAAAAQKALREQQEQEHSTKVLSFLSKFEWRMTSESGAEYSFHEAYPKQQSVAAAAGQDPEEVKEPATKKTKTANDTEEQDNTATTTTTTSVFKAELIYPASERQLARAMPSPGLKLFMETPAMYQAVTKPFIEGIVSSGSLSWLKNIVEVKKEQERLLWNADGWILNIDTKWRTHPDALTVPRSEWYQHDSIVDLYCLGIVKAEGIASLRDLTGGHLSILREMLEQGPKVIEEVYGVPKDQLRIFVHYQPQFYHFHVHFTRLENDTGAQVEKAHLLSDIIQDLEADPECFQKKTLTYKLSLKDKLCKLLEAHSL